MDQTAHLRERLNDVAETTSLRERGALGADDDDVVYRREEGDGVRGDVDAIRSEAQDERSLGPRTCHEAVAQERC